MNYSEFFNMFCLFNYKYFPIFVNLFFRSDVQRLDTTAYTGTMPQVNVHGQQKSGLPFKPDPYAHSIL